MHVFGNHATLADIPASKISPQQIATIVRSVRESGKERTAGVLRSYLRAAYAMAIRAPFDSAVNSQLVAFNVELNPVDAIPAIPVRAGQRTLSQVELRGYLNSLNEGLPDIALKLAVVSGGQRMAQLLSHLHGRKTRCLACLGIAAAWNGGHPLIPARKSR